MSGRVATKYQAHRPVVAPRAAASSSKAWQLHQFLGSDEFAGISFRYIESCNRQMLSR